MKTLDLPSTESPKAVIIIPVTGNNPGMKMCLESLLNQDYANYETFFVTRDMDDPATAVIQELLSGKNNVRHILSGPATVCGQKNHNLLAGVSAAVPSVEILVFCDSSHQAPPGLLSDLIRPIAEGDAVMTTGFHRVAPGDSRLATLGMLWSVLGIHLLQGISAFTQPWGGAMAILRSVFETHGVDRIWAETVVDDFSMGPYLRKEGIRCKPVPTACLTTPLAGQTLNGWNTWLTRQLLYLKFYTPGSWLVAALAVYLLAGSIIIAGVSVICSISGVFPWSMALAGVGFFIIFTGLGMLCRGLVPNPPPPGPWMASFYTLHFMTFWCYAKTWFTNTLSWKDISYKITWRGKVQKITPAT
jgi:cellulose synthase/poly-beta-1,6-N-acetylglucosamine synthase-like glycosyltransferase